MSESYERSGVLPVSGGSLMDRRTRKILSGLHDDIIEILMKCEDIGEAKARLRHILLAINTLLVESKK